MLYTTALDINIPRLARRALHQSTTSARNANSQHGIHLKRYSSGAASSSIKPVELEYDLYPAPSGNKTSGPLVIAHGFLGSKRNWASLSKSFASALNRPVYAIDLRNHGHSPSSSPHNYPTMAADLSHFFRSRELQDVQLLGHSMGGKAVMTYALSEEMQKEDRLGKLVVVDIAPSSGTISAEFREYVAAMKRVDGLGLKTRKEAQAALKEIEPDPAILGFLLTNLDSTPDGVRFRLPLDILLQHIAEIGEFPYAPGERTWDGPALFIKGKKSPYINRKNLPLAEQLFPNMKLEALDAGHWVHAERPHEFTDLLTGFLGKGAEH